MRRWTWMRGTWAFVAAAAVCVGCGQNGEEPGGGPGNGSGPAAKGDDGRAPGNGESKPKPKPPPPPAIPDVVMDESLRATMVACVGDLMPEGELADLGGQIHSVRNLLGKKATVVVFWNSKSLYGLQELQDLDKEVVEPYGAKGVAVVAINVGDPPDAARQALPEEAEGLTVLVDPQGAYFAKVATERLPRTYLLDAEGKILWLDADYSEATRRGIRQTIQVVLGETGT